MDAGLMKAEPHRRADEGVNPRQVKSEAANGDREDDAHRSGSEPAQHHARGVHRRDDHDRADVIDDRQPEQEGAKR